jgi:signal transduction histidine kinase
MESDQSHLRVKQSDRKKGTMKLIKGLEKDDALSFMNWNKYLLIALAALLITSSAIIILESFGEPLGLAWPELTAPPSQLDMMLKTGTRLVILIMTASCAIYAIAHKKKNTTYLDHSNVIQVKDGAKDSKNSRTFPEVKFKDLAFLESISHEIRTPLNGIIGYAEYIQHSSQESMIQFPAQIIYESSQHLLKLIDNLLDLTEIETQRKNMNKNLFSLNKTIDEICRSHLSRITKKNISLRYEFDPKCPSQVVLDENLFRKVLSNLLENAVVFSKDTGEILLSVHYLKNAPALYISIKDDGHGIPEKMHSHVFDKFWQMEDFLANAHGGSALGLALTQKMVNLMGGEINFNSSENVGSIFYFTLPLEKHGIQA